MSPLSAPSVTRKLTIVVDYDDYGIARDIHAQYMTPEINNGYSINKAIGDVDFINKLLVEIYGMIQRIWQNNYD